jgi:hypothetical protein
MQSGDHSLVIVATLTKKASSMRALSRRWRVPYFLRHFDACFPRLWARGTAQVFQLAKSRGRVEGLRPEHGDFPRGPRGLAFPYLRLDIEKARPGESS